MGCRIIRGSPAIARELYGGMEPLKLSINLQVVKRSNGIYKENYIS